MVYTVIVCDLFHDLDPDHEQVVSGFPSAEAAIEYARRRLRSSIEEMRTPGITPEALREQWRTFGEDCRVIGPQGVVYTASQDLARFLAEPASPEACDWVGWRRRFVEPDS
ncbi:MAG: hypothetical protein Fur0018_13150 [Anaerolineales bacterium]